MWLSPESSRAVSVRANITVERRARKRAARVGPGTAHALLLAGFLGAPTSAVAVGSARTTGFLNAANDDAYTPLLSVSFPPRRARLARSCSLRVSSHFFFTVLYNRQSPVLRGPGPESPALLLSSSLSFSPSRCPPSLSPLAASIPGRYFGFANVHVSAKILLNPIPMWLQTGFRLTLRNRAGGGCTIAARDVARHEPRVFIFFVMILGVRAIRSKRG